MEEKKIKQQHRKASLVSKEKNLKKQKKIPGKIYKLQSEKKSEFMLRYQWIYRKVSLQLLMKILLYITHTYTNTLKQ